MTDEERRAADQDAAIEAAFLAAKLPEEDRRSSDVYEWIQRGDGAHILYKNGQVCDQREREFPAV
jgi:hypothetical protein